MSIPVHSVHSFPDPIMTAGECIKVHRPSSYACVRRNCTSRLLRERLWKCSILAARQSDVKNYGMEPGAK